MPSIGWQELIIILVIILVIFGPKRLPEVGRSLGKGIREFRKSTTEIKEQLTEEKQEPPPAGKTGEAGKAGEGEQPSAESPETERSENKA